MSHDRGFSFFGGETQHDTDGFHLGDDNVPPSVKAEREEAARKRREKAELLRQIDQERVRLREEEKRALLEAERKKKDAQQSANAPERSQHAAHADDFDEDKYGPPPVREIYDPLENYGAKAPYGAQASSPATQSLDSPSRNTQAPQSASSPIAQSLDHHAGGTPAPHIDDDERYAPPPKNSYGVKLKPGSLLEGIERRAPLPQRAPHPGAGAGGAPKIEMPFWQKVTGLWPKQEATMNRNQRREAIKKLRTQFEVRIRESLGEYEREQRDAAEKCASKKLSMHEIELLPASDRTFLWSPLDAICHELTIARRKLSAYMRELTGMSAQEVIDKIKAEWILIRLKEKLAAQAKLDYEVRLATAQPEKKEWSVISAAGDLLKGEWHKRRESPGIAWSENHRYAARQQFARELGFSSYNRLYRACLLCFGKTVMELEHAAAVGLFVELDKEVLNE